MAQSDESDALIGSTGFVGSNLRRMSSFGSLFNSTNIDGIRGRKFRRLVSAAPGAEKWKANLDPASDRAAVEKLWHSLESVEAGKVILISTVDVYPHPVGVDENSEIDMERCSPYGRHRLELERKVADRFDALIVRLPGLFGPGLRKNALYDLLNDHRVPAIDSGAIYQFYDITRLAGDLELAERANLALLNVATEPIGIDLVAREVFDTPLVSGENPIPARYDFRTLHAEFFGGRDGYLQSSNAILEEIREWVRSERKAGT